MTLKPIATPSESDWLMIQCNDPRIYRYFGNTDTFTHVSKIYPKKLFIIEEYGKRIGCAGFSKIDQHSKSADIIIFIVSDYQKRGHGKKALLKLLDIAFEDLQLSNIRAEVLDYPKEYRFGFFKRLGFEEFSKECQNIRYKKQEKWVNAIKIFMTRDVWSTRYKKALECVQ